MEDKKHIPDVIIPEGKKQNPIRMFKYLLEFEQMLKYFADNDILIDQRYGTCDKRIIDYCAENKLIITRLQVETCTINAPAYLRLHNYRTEATSLGLASDPPSPHSLAVSHMGEIRTGLSESPVYSLASVAPSPLSLAHHDETPSYSPVSSDEEGS